MKKAFRNLVLRSETLRTLISVDLSRAVGGFDSGDFQCRKLFDSGDKQCPLVLGSESGAKQCPNLFESGDVQCDGRR